MIVQCPECSSRYLLAESLMGPAGARVRCPACRASFEVRRIESARGVESPATASDPALEAAIARLEAQVPRILSAQERGVLFSEAGELLHAAFAAYRDGSRDASAVEFREALQRRWGIELPGAVAGGASR